jgi:hypothetical protein
MAKGKVQAPYFVVGVIFVKVLECHYVSITTDSIRKTLHEHLRCHLAKHEERGVWLWHIPVFLPTKRAGHVGPG